MAKRHNEFSRLLGTVENDIVPLKEQMGVGDTGMGIPPANVPDLEVMANDCQMMSDQLGGFSDRLKAMADMQPNFADQFNAETDVMPGGY